MSYQVADMKRALDHHIHQVPKCSEILLYQGSLGGCYKRLLPIQSAFVRGSDAIVAEQRSFCVEQK